jgi:hypothetical protein
MPLVRYAAPAVHPPVSLPSTKAAGRDGDWGRHRPAAVTSAKFDRPAFRFFYILRNAGDARRGRRSCMRRLGPPRAGHFGLRACQCDVGAEPGNTNSTRLSVRRLQTTTRSMRLTRFSAYSCSAGQPQRGVVRRGRARPAVRRRVSSPSLAPPASGRNVLREEAMARLAAMDGHTGTRAVESRRPPE